MASRDEFLGVDFQPFAIANNRFIGGFSNIAAPDAWIYTATDGTRWNIELTVTVSEPDWARWTVTATPYGTFRFANAFYGITNVPDIQTGSVASYSLTAEGISGVTNFDEIASNSVILLDISKTGSFAAFGLGGLNNDGLYENFNPNNLSAVTNQRKAVTKADAQRNSSGPSVIWEAGLSGTPGVDLALVVNVVRNQATCAGTIVSNKWEDNDITQHWSGTYASTCLTSGLTFTRPGLASGCTPPAGPVGPVAHSTLSLLSPATNGPIAAACGWTRELSDSTDVIDEPTNEYLNFKWWTFTDVGANDPWPFWGPASKEYVVNENVNHNGIIFNCTVAHTSDDFKRPGLGNNWTDFWEIPYEATNHDVSDVPLWAEATAYNRHDAVREGAADYWLAKNKFTSYDSSDPDATNHDQPNTGDNFAEFWDGPFNVLLNPVWIEDRLVLKDWIIESTYTDPAIAVDGTITSARWKCLRSHVSAVANKPGAGVDWTQYWEKAISETSGSQWEPPLIYQVGDKVASGSPVKLYEANAEHTATALNTPPNAVWTENTTAINCRAAVGTLETALNQTAYHVKDHRTRTESIDFHITRICAGAFYTDAEVLKIIETDVHYTRELSDENFDFTWDWTDEMVAPPPPGGQASGNILRTGATCDETLVYQFRVDGSVKHTINMAACATATGSDVWTEDFDGYPKTWTASGTRTLTFDLDFVRLVDVNETFTQADTQWAGKTGDDILVGNKVNWNSNDFVSGKTFQWIDTPYMTPIKDRLENGALNFPTFPGIGLGNYPGTGVALDAISALDQYETKRPDRDADQIKYGEPFPTLLTLFYGRHLAGPFIYGRKSNSGIALDSQYLFVLENDDFNWIQYGVFGPDAQQASKITLTHTSPDETPLATWLFNKDYGDDIACAYDPINQVIHRNSQYRVVYV
ncbi:MAG: hypothetical protein ACYST3_08310 [Planctomycetota bacterium]